MRFMTKAVPGVASVVVVASACAMGKREKRVQKTAEKVSLRGFWVFASKFWPKKIQPGWIWVFLCLFSGTKRVRFAAGRTSMEGPASSFFPQPVPFSSCGVLMDLPVLMDGQMDGRMDRGKYSNA